MDKIFNEVEIGLPSNIPQNLNKKMRKRKQLDALVKFRSTKPSSKDILQSSEDELFLPYQKTSITKSRSSRPHRCWKYSQYILSFGLVCIFIIVCVGFTYANIELKNEVQSLSSRINEIEEKFSNNEIEQIKRRLTFLERWNFSFIYDQLQIQKLNQATKIEDEWYDPLNSLRNEIQNLNQTAKVQELKTRFEQLNNLVYNSSNKTSIILKKFQSDLDELRSQIDQCNCSKDTKLNKLSHQNNQTENSIDVEEIINQV